MNWGAVLFSCVLAPRVCRPAGKNGGVSLETPPFLGEAPNFPFEAPHFSCAAGECAVCSEERCAVSRPPREGGAEAARQLGRRARRSGGGVKNMPGGVVDRWWDSASERRQNDVFSGCDEKNVGGLQKKCTENCFGRDFTNIIFRKSLRWRLIL